MKNIIIILSLLIGTGVVNEIKAQDAIQNDTLQLWVDGVCGMCQERIQNVAISTIGVRYANWDAATKMLTITRSPEPFNVNDLHQGLTSIGHDTKVMKASDEAYESLHACCKYRDEEVIKAHQPNYQEAQASNLNGLIVEDGRKGEQVPIVGATVYWLGDETGVLSDEEGTFQIEKSEDTKQLVISYVGYQADTIVVDRAGDVVITLSSALLLDEVTVTSRKRTTTVSFIEASSIQLLSEKELLKAACCSLAESFETTASVDASFTDAVTGTRKIEMLGLASPYLQITRENMPDVRGLSALHGLDYTAGAWIEGIQLNTGAGSVVNGFESLTGQINVELWKPETAAPLYFNAYANAMGRLEGNLNLNKSLNERVHTGLLLHTKNQQIENDRNNDGFLDNPLSTRYVGINRWKFVGKSNWRAQAGIKVVHVDDESGQLNEMESPWRATHRTNRVEAWSKTGYVFADRPYASMGLQLSGVWHDATSTYGLRPYDATQHSIYANFIYQSIIVDSRHQFKTGLSFQWDKYEEVLDTRAFDRNESIPGAFFEYTLGKGEPFTAVAGIRGDYHNQFGFFMTPRLHLRYAFNDQIVWRVSGGRGQRTASIIAENLGMLASSRAIVIQGENRDTPYGLDAEVAWNVGTTLNWEFLIGERSALFSASYFHTRFENQIVVDYDQDPQAVYFYNLEGNSYSNSIQTQLDWELFTRFDVRMAYRLNDVQVDYLKGQLEKPLISRHRAFLNMAYETENEWKFDVTANWQSARRIPGTATNPVEFQREDYSPDFVLMNIQVTKSWGRKWEIYLGGENILNYRQDNPIIAVDDPFGSYFDASLVWGPIFGRNMYLGMRYRIEGEE
jgi:outer membrane receptor for ferrienterochelin and colicins